MFTDKNIDKYVSEHTSPEDSVLHELVRATRLRTMQPRMLSGHIQGKLLEMISKMVLPRRILEIGTFTGYSAICLAKGLVEGGLLYTIEINDELEDIAAEFIEKSDVAGKIIRLTGNALDIIPEMDERFDIVFIDGDKREYPKYYESVINTVRKGGFIVADNVLWNGKVVEKVLNNDKYTQGMIEFNNMVTADERVENVLLPFRDGLMIIRLL